LKIDMEENLLFSPDSLYFLIDISHKNKKLKNFTFSNISQIDIILNASEPEKFLPVKEELTVIKLFDNFDISGLLVKIIDKEKIGESIFRLFVSPLSYVKITKVIDYNRYAKVKVVKANFKEISDIKKKDAYLSLLKKYFKEYSLYKNIDDDTGFLISSENDILKIIDSLLFYVDIDDEELKMILTETDLEKRTEKVIKHFLYEIEKVKIENEIFESVIKKDLEKSRKHLLMEQMKIIRSQLGEKDDKEDEILKIKTKILNSDLKEHAKEKALEELEKLKDLTVYSPEYSLIKNYIEWILSLPWEKTTPDNFDIKLAKKILNGNHYGLDKVKERILEFLSVLKLSGNQKGCILCFVGPPGVGKTSLGHSIAQAMGRKFVRVSVGGIKDESEIKGHRRTYVGSMPGRIIQMMKRAKVVNPVFMLDEVDKMGGDFKGDPSNALLEIFDPDINDSFSDHYLEIDYDLSKVLFICTANVIHTIPAPLRDRMEIVEISGYLENEKVEIGKRFLIPKIMKKSGLKANQIYFKNDGILKIIRNYSPEPGIRGLEKNIQTIIGKRAKEIALGQKIKDFKIGEKEVLKYLGPELYLERTKNKKVFPGVVNGLAWTPLGGKVLTIETLLLKGSGNIQITSQVGDVMKESAKTAISFLRKNYKFFGIDDEFYKKYDIHIHIPEGSIPKDGPSAGITITMSILSSLREKPISPDFAMTGEITLTGMILPVGGLLEKIVAAQIDGIKNIIIPDKNKNYFSMIPQYVKKNLNFFFVGDIYETSKILFR